MVFGTGLAFFLGKPLIKPTAPQLPSLDLGAWSDVQAVRAALKECRGLGGPPLAQLYTSYERQLDERGAAAASA